MKPKIFYTRRIFLIDGLGALVNFVFMGIIWPCFYQHFGLPLNTLYLLATVISLYFFFSVSCYFLIKENWQHYLRIIVMANTAYAFLTLIVIGYYFKQLTIWTYIYFPLELTCLTLLITIELKVIIKKQKYKSI